MVIDPMSGQVAAVAAMRELYERQLGTPDRAGDDLRARGGTYRTLASLAGLDELYDIERATTEPGT